VDTFFALSRYVLGTGSTEYMNKFLSYDTLVVLCTIAVSSKMCKSRGEAVCITAVRYDKYRMKTVQCKMENWGV
jgi:hypothetical protein